MNKFENTNVEYTGDPFEGLTQEQTKLVMAYCEEKDFTYDRPEAKNLINFLKEKNKQNEARERRAKTYIDELQTDDVDNFSA